MEIKTVSKKRKLLPGLDMTQEEFIARETVRQLTSGYLLNAEYPYLPTKDKRYRRAILPAHFILYRITKDRIEVLNILHQAVSITQAKKNRNIKP